MHEPGTRQLFRFIYTILLILICQTMEGQTAIAADAKLQQEIQSAKFIENIVLMKLDGESAMRTSDDRVNLDKITHIYKELMDRYPGSTEAQNAYAEFLWNIEQHSEAMAYWESAEKLDSHNAAIANNLGKCYLALGDAKRATEYYIRASTLAPQNPFYHFNLGNALFLFRHQVVGDFASTPEAVLERSLEHFREAARLAPFNTDYARAYAETFYGLAEPNWETALKAWLNYFEVSSNKDFAYTNLARVTLKLGRKKEALDYLNKVKNSSFNSAKGHLLRQLEVQKYPKPVID